MDEGIAITAIAAMSRGMLAGCAVLTKMRTAMQISGKTYKIGIVQQQQHGSLDEANQGMIDGLKDNGYVVGENVTAGFSKCAGRPE